MLLKKRVLVGSASCFLALLCTAGVFTPTYVADVQGNDPTIKKSQPWQEIQQADWQLDRV
ncbi:MAG: hypothetical protein Q4C74_07575 [Rothia sp. (in: high G+C Gram-positive bacteria)]|nr:hypothetical protein [Rothia sp. (in: high G+C Gram-positive bacteria)]